MKQLMASVLFILLIHSAKAQDVIFMRNGDEIKAKVSEVSNSEIKYKRSDNITGPDYSALKKDVMMIKYENGTKDIFKEEPAANNSAQVTSTVKGPPKAPSKFYNVTQIGFAAGVGKVNLEFGGYNYSAPNDINILKLNSISGGKINDYFMIGAGTGIHYYFADGEHAFALPLYADIRSNILGKQTGPVVFFDIGGTFNIHNAESFKGLFYEPGIGINVPGIKSGFNLSISYLIQNIKVQYYDYNYNGYSYSPYISEFKYSLKFISIKLGMSF